MLCYLKIPKINSIYFEYDKEIKKNNEVFTSDGLSGTLLDDFDEKKLEILLPISMKNKCQIERMEILIRT